MKFRTTTELPSKRLVLQPQSRLLLLGSCFAEHIGQKMLDGHMRARVNPMGVLYNPESIRRCIEVLTNGTYDERYLFEDASGMWHSWLHSGKFDAVSREEALTGIKASLDEGHKRLQEADVIFVTFGTSRVYRHKASDMVVANCHREPSATFREETMSVEEIVSSWQALLSRLPERMKVVFTVSPYRYAKYGMHGNRLSKATLLLAVDALCRADDRCLYFPAYEIVLDELRDYRFYAPDMLHVSEQAVEYVWERFRAWAFTEEMTTFAQEWAEISKALAHRPLHPDSEAFRRFEAATKERLRQFKARWGTEE